MALRVMNVTLQQPSDTTGWNIINPDLAQRKRIQKLFAVPVSEDIFTGRNGMMSTDKVFGAGWNILKLVTEMSGGSRHVTILVGGDMPLPILAAIAQLTKPPWSQWKESRASCVYLQDGKIVYCGGE